MIGLIKLAIGFTSGMGGGMIVGNIIKAGIPTNVGRAGKVLYKMGEIGLTGLVSVNVWNYTDKVIDEGVDAYKTIQSERRKKKEEKTKEK